ncbi:iron ABC transporter permease [Lactiplantibacillus fabifermentans T30PCM01]|uniref:Iron ABC transporter permease n=2 Tax=Lactiplantibacillus fabifermentans TaxID=483011 RepID=W6T711_9LACO|nr:iron ABC transporter permease [Lactiplantibacillus fabifermentans]ETY73583.1 iron ABC transporter permease [Lactiplantibacillus fabifermentans T30PCM01]
MQNKRRFYGWLLGLSLTLIILTIANLNTGTMRLQPTAIFAILTGHGTYTQNLVLLNFRLPRIVLAIIVGWALALSGSVLQTTTQNSLADPSLLGINTGAGLGVMLLMLLAGDMSSIATYGLPLVALAGALLSTLLVFACAYQPATGCPPNRLLLTGIALSGCFSAVMVLMTLKLSPDNYQFVMNWLAGSMWGTSWPYIAMALPWLIVGTLGILSELPVLSAFTLGDDAAQALGVSLRRHRLILMALAAMLAGVSVALSGAISFVGLITPNLARQLVGSHQRYQLILAGLLGSSLLLAADTLGKLITTTTELPVGVLVAVIGAPYFIYVLVKKPTGTPGN